MRGVVPPLLLYPTPRPITHSGRQNRYRDPGKGIVVHVNNAYDVGTPNPWPEVHMNERGQVLTQVIMDTGANYVIIATPN